MTKEIFQRPSKKSIHFTDRLVTAHINFIVSHYWRSCLFTEDRNVNWLPLHSDFILTWYSFVNTNRRSDTWSGVFWLGLPRLLACYDWTETFMDWRLCSFTTIFQKHISYSFDWHGDNQRTTLPFLRYLTLKTKQYFKTDHDLPSKSTFSSKFNIAVRKSTANVQIFLVEFFIKKGIYFEPLYFLIGGRDGVFGIATR